MVTGSAESLELNEAGQVRGYASRYNGGDSDLGRSAWLFDGAATFDIGLTGAEHTRNDGYKESVSYELNEAGQVNGVSRLTTVVAANLGLSAWLTDSATTVDIGLVDGEHAETTATDTASPATIILKSSQ